MTIQIDYETDRELDIDYARLADMVADKILDSENCPYEASVNLVLTDNEEIKRVNSEFRFVGAPTDVLSFPMIPFEKPADYSIIEDKDEYFDLDTGELLLGDVMISVDKVWSQAEEYGHSREREFSFIFWDMIIWSRGKRPLWRKNSRRPLTLWESQDEPSGILPACVRRTGK